MTAFMIAGLDVRDDAAGASAAYAAYGAAAREAPFLEGVSYLVRGGTVHTMEGVARRRYVVMQFPDMGTIRNWYSSAAYQAAKQLRAGISEADFVAVEGMAAASAQGVDGSSSPKAGYLFARFDVRDPDTYKRYVEAAAPAFTQYRARFLARGGNSEALEGSARGRNVLIEFPSVDLALACYHSPTYQTARRTREPVATGDVVILEAA